jgi:alanyl-tRNA synthetase
MSARAYYDDSYTHSFAARITEHTLHNGAPAVVLDQTYFYPTSGGQPHDVGSINGIPVVDVVTREGDAAVLHVLASAPDPAASDITCQIDWTRRFDHMQHHTGQHILTQAFVQTAHAPTVSFHLSDNSVTIDLDKSALTDAQAADTETLANQIIWQNRTVTAQVIDPNDADNVRIRRLPPHLLTGGLRIIDIDGFDVTACGGTHVARTGEIGLLKIVRLEKRGDKTRVEFCCGTRALADYRARHEVTTALTASLTVGLSEVTASVTRLQEGFRAAQRDLKAATSTLLGYEAQAILAGLPAGEKAVIVRVFEGRSADDLKTLAAALTARPVTVALLAGTGEKTSCVFARSADLGHDMGALLKDTLAGLGGRGGGQPTLAQGAAPAGDTESIRAALERAAAALA